MVAIAPATVVASIVATLSGRPLPLEGAAEFLMEWTPVPLANALLDHLGAAARPAALLGSLALLMLAGGLAGAIYEVIRGWSGLIGLAAAASVLGLFLLLWFPAGFLLASLVLIVVWAVELWLTLCRSTLAGGRRAFLIRSGAVLGGAAVLLTLFSLRPVFDALASPRLFPFRRTRGIAIDGLADLVTPNDAFYRMDKVLLYPEIETSSWQLRVDGEVRTPLTIGYDELLRLPRVNRYVTMECVDNPVGGPLIGTALWTGAALGDILRKAGAQGDTIAFHAPDQYSERVPRMLAEEAGAIVAYGMNGDVLPREHGYPVRIVLPGVYGFKSVKWLTGMTIDRINQTGNWYAQGWTEEGRIHTAIRIDVARREGARVLIAGIAFGGRRGIRAVQVQANGGPWVEATLGPSLSPESWVQWVLSIEGPGPISLVARAVDGTGHIQTERAMGPYPDGATGWARRRV